MILTEGSVPGAGLVLGLVLAFWIGLAVLSFWCRARRAKSMVKRYGRKP